MSEEQVLKGLLPDDVPLLMDGEIVSTDPEVLRRLAELPVDAGDCVVDYLQGLYWSAKNRDLLAWEAPKDVCTPEPIICCGSGPSLDPAIPRLRELQHHYRIVCAHSALERLLEADIIPDAYTPIERVSPSIFNMPLHQLPEQVVYGGISVVPDEHTRCANKLCVVSKDNLHQWYPSHQNWVSRGTMSGTLAAGLSLGMTTGKVFLVGHDLAFGHYKGYAYPENEASHTVECVDGETRKTDFFMYRAARELGGMCDGRLVQCAPTGALIAGADAGDLPRETSSHKVVRTPQRVDAWRVAQFESRLRLLPSEWRAGMKRVAEATKPDDLAIGNLFPGAKNIVAFHSLLRSIYLSLSIEKRCGRADIVVDWFKEIMANMDYDIAITFEDITNDLA